MRARKGEPLKIEAKTWNKVEALVNPSNPMLGRDPIDRYRRCDLIRIKNASGADLTRGKILSWSGVSFDATANPTEYWAMPTLTGKTPEFPEDHGRIAVLQEPIKNGGIGLAAIGGITPASINMTATSHPYAYLSDGSTASLVSATSGSCEILHVSGTGTGVKTCLIHLGSSQHFWRYDLDSPGTGSLLGMDGIDTGLAVTIEDPLSMFTDQVAGNRGYCKQVGPDFYAVQGPCNE